MHGLAVPHTSEVDDQQPSLATVQDGSWSRPPYDLVCSKSVRHDAVSKVFAGYLGRCPRRRKSLCKCTPWAASKWESPRVRLDAINRPFKRHDRAGGRRGNRMCWRGRLQEQRDGKE